MPHQTEPSVNNAMGTLLGAMLPRSEVRSENTQAIYGHPGLRPDILITAPGRAPVVIEAEYMPAAGVEAEAKDRLGHKTTAYHRVIEAAIALRYPNEIGDAQDLSVALTDARLSYCVFTENNGASRFPESGWLEGSVDDLADLVRLVSVPQHAVDRATAILQEGIDGAAKILDELDQTNPGITGAIANLLGMANVLQTRRMACAIIANALVFHDQIAGMHARIKSLAHACGDSVDNPQGEVLAAWAAILNVNYWPIFSIARDILTHMDSGTAARILRRLRNTAQGVNATGVENAHDLTGRIFQRLIADRKYLATFYTLPASAALLARLAVAKLERVDWSSPEEIGKLRIGDFACGTGALLSAVYEQIAARHERAGGDGSKLHKVMMEEVLYGCDVMPSAIHITGSTLSGVEPAVGFTNSRLYTMPYGRQKDGSVMIGSLELLQSSRVQTLFSTSDPALRTGSAGEEAAAQMRTQIPDEGFDLVIMNPPFTKAGSDWEGSERDEDSIKHFKGLSTDLDTQKDMAKSLKRYTKDTCYHGYAGIASAFAALAHKKIKHGGILALVLPLSASVGQSWQRLRKMLANHYKGLTVLSIAADRKVDTSFSSDTGMAECLIIARKRRPDEGPDKVNHFVSLLQRPQGFAHASSLEKGYVGANRIRSINSGPFGGTRLMIGSELAGEVIDSPHGDNDWNAIRLLDCSVAQTAYSLSDSSLWLPGLASSVKLKMAELSEVGKRGLYHVNIAGSSGPFKKLPASPTSTYPSLWNHDAKRETRIICIPDTQLQVRQGMERKAVEVWETASRAHLNLDFQFNSQPLKVAFTEQPSIGGRAWPNVIFDDMRFDYGFAVWANCTLGLLCFWWHSNRQVSGRGTTTITAAESLPILDLRCLTDKQLLIAKKIFEEFRNKDFLPAYLADADPNRALLDRRVICDLLDFGEEIYKAVRLLSAKWCAEPSVHGGKKRPKGARLVV